MIRIELFQGEHSRMWFWHAKSSNGQVMCASQGYMRRANALKTIKRLFREPAYFEIVEVES